MDKAVVCGKGKGEFYISVESNIGHDYRITRYKKEAYVFCNRDMHHAHFIADAWGMEVKEIF